MIIDESIDQLGADTKPICDFCLLLVILEVRPHDIFNLRGLELVEPPLLLASRLRWVGPTDILLLLLVILFVLLLQIHHALLSTRSTPPHQVLVLPLELSFQVLGLLFKLLPDGDGPPRPSVQLRIAYPICVESEVIMVPHECLWVEDICGGYSMYLSLWLLCITFATKTPPLFEQIIGQHPRVVLFPDLILQRTDASPPEAVVLLPYLLLLGLPPPSLPPAPTIAMRRLLSRVGIPPKIRPHLTQPSFHIADFSRIL